MRRLPLLLAAIICAANSQQCPPLGAMGRTSSDPSLMAAAKREIQASLARDGKAASAQHALEDVLWNKKETVLILDNRVIVDRSFLRHAKHPAHAALAASVGARRALPNAAYRFSAGTRGVKRSGCTRPFPLAVITKMTGYDQCGVLVPNPYFGPDLDAYARQTGEARALARARPLASRVGRALWRGNISSRACDKELGNRARLAATALSVDFPDLFDARCPPGGCDPRPPSEPCDEADVAARILADYGGSAAPTFANYTATMVAAAADPSAYLVGGYVPPSKFSDWKYALHLPGAFTGSYSRNLNKLWALGSVVLLWAAPYVEFYFPGLSHGATHLAVDACTAPRAVAALEADGGRAADLAAGAGRVFDELLCADCLADFYVAAVEGLRAHYDLGSALDGGRDAAAFLRGRTNCSDLDLVAVRGSRPWSEKYGRGLPTTHVLTEPVDCATLFQ